MRPPLCSCYRLDWWFPVVRGAISRKMKQCVCGLTWNQQVVCSCLVPTSVTTITWGVSFLQSMCQTATNMNLLMFLSFSSSICLPPPHVPIVIQYHLIEVVFKMFSNFTALLNMSRTIEYGVRSWRFTLNLSIDDFLCQSDSFQIKQFMFGGVMKLWFCDTELIREEWMVVGHQPTLLALALDVLSFWWQRSDK